MGITKYSRENKLPLAVVTVLCGGPAKTGKRVTPWSVRHEVSDLAGRASMTDAHAAAILEIGRETGEVALPGYTSFREQINMQGRPSTPNRTKNKRLRLTVGSCDYAASKSKCQDHKRGCNIFAAGGVLLTERDQTAAGFTMIGSTLTSRADRRATYRPSPSIVLRPL
jgi:hypothetical protein